MTKRNAFVGKISLNTSQEPFKKTIGTGYTAESARYVIARFILLK